MTGESFSIYSRTAVPRAIRGDDCVSDVTKSISCVRNVSQRNHLWLLWLFSFHRLTLRTQLQPDSNTIGYNK